MIKTLENNEKLHILSKNYIGYLAYNYKSNPYVLPITYFYNEEQNNIICYSAEGHKIEALRKNNNIAMCVTDIESINNWKSIMVNGTYKEHTGSEAIALLHQFSLGIKDLIIRNEKRSLDFINQFSSKIDFKNIPIIYTIEIKTVTGRKRKL